MKVRQMLCDTSKLVRLRWRWGLLCVVTAMCLLLGSCSGPPDDPAIEIKPLVGEHAPAGEFQPFYFVQVSDPHLGVSKRADARFAKVAAQVNVLKPDFVVLTGDLTYSLTDRHVAVIDAAIKQFQVPVKLIPGNHDVYTIDSLATYRRQYGKDFYVFTHNNCDFIFLDSATLDLETPGGF